MERPHGSCGWSPPTDDRPGPTVSRRSPRDPRRESWGLQGDPYAPRRYGRASPSGVSLAVIRCALVLVLACSASPHLPAQEPPGADGAPSEEKERGWLEVLAGERPDRDRIIGGLWAMHPFEPQFPELDATRGFGGLYGHWFGATFVNSYDVRTFILGIERSWLSLRRGVFGAGAGYRVGLITGYDERLIGLARHTPVLPFGGVLVWTQVGPVGIDSYYVYRAITLEASLVF